MINTKHLKGDLTGGSIAAVLSLPEAMAFGALVFGAISPEFLSIGVVAGLTGLAVSNLIGAFAGGVRIMNSGPYALACLMLASSVTLLVDQYPVFADNPEFTILGLLVLVFLSGCMQVVFGVLGIGSFAKFIPYPVIAGLMNGLSVLIVIGQVKPMLGLAWEVELSLASVLQFVQPLTLLVGLVTIVSVFLCRHWETKVPAPILGIFFGSSCYYLIAIAFPEQPLGPTIGSIPTDIPMPKYTFEILGFLSSSDILPMLGSLLTLSFGIALVTSLRTLLGAVAIDNITRERSNTNRELVSQGFGNMAGSLFGAVTVAGYSGQPIANFTYGGRTRLARFTVGFFALAVVVFLGPIISKIPNVVLSGLLITIAWGAADRWSFGLVQRFFSADKMSSTLIVDLILVFIVTGGMVFVGLFEGVGIGICASIFIFLYRMSKKTIRRTYDAQRVRSNVERSILEINLLEEHADSIRIFELEGSLFFGTTDNLAEAIDKIDDKKMRCLILDFSRVSDIDSTGTNILLQIKERLHGHNVTFMLSSIYEEEGVGLGMKQQGFLALFDAELIFRELDRALGQAEDNLLDALLTPDRYQNSLNLNEIDLFKKLSAEDLETLEKYLRHREYKDKEAIYEQYAQGDGFSVVVSGQVDLVVESQKQGAVPTKLVATLCPGTVCGEMAVFDGGLRSATAYARADVATLWLSSRDIEKLRVEEPAIIIELMAGLGRELAKRMRIANRLNTELRI